MEKRLETGNPEKHKMNTGTTLRLKKKTTVTINRSKGQGTQNLGRTRKTTRVKNAGRLDT